jgi:4-hydroxy-tetrahydrodipicolinate synthase
MLKGSITALITPMTEDGSIDSDAYQKFMDWQIRQGTHGLVPVGTTGESPTVTHDEHKHLISLAVETSAGRVPVVAGTGSNSTREAVSLTQSAENLGVDAVLVVTPYYNKPSQDGLYAHFKEIHDNSNIPIVIYNIPARSVVDMNRDTMACLFELPRIIGVKDATGDLARCADQRLKMGPDFIQLSGEDATAVGFNAMGGVGCISVTSNVAPALCAKMQNATLEGDYKTALECQDLLIPLHQAIFMEPSPAPAKFGASLLGLSMDRVRLPLISMSKNGRARLEIVMENLNLPRADY